MSSTTEIACRFVLTLRNNSWLQEEREKNVRELGQLHVAKDKAGVDLEALRKKYAELEVSLGSAKEKQRERKMLA